MSKSVIKEHDPQAGKALELSPKVAAGIAHEPYAAGPSRFPGCAWGYLGGMVFSAAGIAHEPCTAGPSGSQAVPGAILVEWSFLTLA